MISGHFISLNIRGRSLLNFVSIDVKPGLFTAIAGPNGAGKSSLLKILANETASYQGKVTVNGKPMKSYDIAALSKVRAVLPQSTHLQFSFTVKQIVMLGTHYHKNSVAQNEKICEEVMALTEVTEWRDRNYLTLSGGEQQRVNLARVLAQVWEERPYARYILLDEPTSNLDIAQKQLIFSLVRYACLRNIGVLAIVHDLNQIAQFADTIYFMRNGNVVAHGGTKAVFTKENIEETFSCKVNVHHDPATNSPYILTDDSRIIDSTTFKTSDYEHH